MVHLFEFDSLWASVYVPFNSSTTTKCIDPETHMCSDLHRDWYALVNPCCWLLVVT